MIMMIVTPDRNPKFIVNHSSDSYRQAGFHLENGQEGGGGGD